MEYKRNTANYKPKSDLETAKNQVLNYLNGLYKDTFALLSATAISWAENYETFTVTSKTYSGQTFLVRRIHEGSAISFTDNYFTLYMTADAKQYVESIVNQASLKADVAIEFTEGQLPKTLKPGASFRNYVEMGGSPFCYITLTTAGELNQKEQMSLMKILAKERFQCNVLFVSNTSCHCYGVDWDHDIQDYNPTKQGGNHGSF